jgi:NAD(P)-dependent dehydrogenase (short-subunit alcohol dehydrogenase family)
MTVQDQPGRYSRRRALAFGAVGLTAGTLGAGAGVAGAGVAGVNAAGNKPPAGRGSRFAGKVVLITGATSGIGEATARAMAGEGATVVFCGRRLELGRQVEGSMRSSGGDATFVRADVRNENEVRDLVDGCVSRHGRLDIAVNNAGIESPRAARLHEQSMADMEEVWRTNVGGVFLGLKYQIPRMLAQGGGTIINTASISAEVGFATIAPYNSSKHAVASLTKVAALEYAADRIRINAFAPGAVDTPMLRRAAAAFGVSYEQIAQDYPIKRIVRPEEIAAVVMWLASEESSAVAGADVDASGGYLAG